MILSNCHTAFFKFVLLLAVCALRFDQRPAVDGSVHFVYGRPLRPVFFRYANLGIGSSAFVCPACLML